MANKRDKSERQQARATGQRPFDPHARPRSDDGNAFLPDPEGGPARSSEDLAESLAEEFVEAATSGEDRDEEVLDATFSEEMGGPFIETGPAEEMAGSVDDMNPADADREPLPLPVAGLVTDPDLDDQLDAQAENGEGADEHVSAADADRTEPPDPARSIDELNDESPGGRTTG
jgi:hypothetical protein